MAFGFGVAAGPLLSGFLVAYGFATPFIFAAALAGLGALIVLTQVEEVLDLDGPGDGDADIEPGSLRGETPVDAGEPGLDADADTRTDGVDD